MKDALQNLLESLGNHTDANLRGLRTQLNFNEYFTNQK